MEVGDFDCNSLKEIAHSFSKMACMAFVCDNMAVCQLLSDKASFELLMAAGRMSKVCVEDTDFEVYLEIVIDMTNMKKWTPDLKNLLLAMEKQVEKVQMAYQKQVKQNEKCRLVFEV